jgi:dephospho-CoA kinase
MANPTPSDRRAFKPLVVGLTGGIAAGKSLVGHMLKALGAEIWDADAAAKSLYRTDPALRQALLDRWGEDLAVRDETGAAVDILRPALASLVFADPDELAWLESVVHPAVAHAFDAWLAGVGSVSAPAYVVREAALLFESGSHRTCDLVVTVEAPDDVRAARAVKRGRGEVTEQQVRDRMRRQLSRQERAKAANWVLENGPNDALLPQVLELHALIEARVATRQKARRG